MNINGYSNEYYFVKYLNGKYIKELNPMFKMLIEDLYGLLEDNLVIKCWLNDKPQKADFFIEINDIVKGISLKMGSRNSVHVERISDFIHFLIENKIDRDVIIEYLKYHYADGSTNGSGKYRMSVDKYKKENQTKIDSINLAINNLDLLNKIVDKFILKGNNSDSSIACIIHGTTTNFIWILSSDIRKIVLSKNNIYQSAVHFGPITCQPKSRCLNYNPIY